MRRRVRKVPAGRLALLVGLGLVALSCLAIGACAAGGGRVVA